MYDTGKPFPTGVHQGKRRAGWQLVSKLLHHITLARLALHGAISECRFSPSLWTIARPQPTCRISNKRRGCPPPLVLPLLPAYLLAGWRAFRLRDVERIGRFVHEDGARHRRGTGQVVVRHRRVPPTTSGVERDEVVAGRRAPTHVTRSRRTGDATDLAGDLGAVLDGVGEERLLSGHQVTKVGLHRGDVGLPLRIGELRDRDGGQDADDHHHDQQLNERKSLAVHVAAYPRL